MWGDISLWFLFAFPWWLVAVEYLFLAFVYLLWKNVYSFSLPIFESELGVFFIYMVSEYFLPFFRLSFHLLMVSFFCKAVSLFFTFWTFCWFGCAVRLAGSSFSNQELNQGSWQWKHQALTTGPPGTPQSSFSLSSFYILSSWWNFERKDSVSWTNV